MKPVNFAARRQYNRMVREHPELAIPHRWGAYTACMALGLALGALLGVWLAS